jgi:5'-3' exonuclease
VEQVVIVTPDKDLGQCVRGTRVVQFDRRKQEIVDEAAVTTKFGVGPASIADYLALVGDSADGYPGLPGWGAKSAAAVLAAFGTIEQIPPMAADWHIPGLRGADKLAATLRSNMADALLFRTIATIDCSVEVGDVDSWRWRGPGPRFAEMASALGASNVVERAERLASRLG